MLNLEFAQLSDPGKSRDHNEDFLGHAEPETPERVRSHGWLFALADGVGGHADGEVASHAVVEHLVSGFRAAPANEAPGTLLARLVQAANVHVYDTARKARPGGSSMAYAASKAGLIHLTRCLAVALAPDVAVNCIAPGLVEGTRMAGRLPEAMKQVLRTQTVLGRSGSADDIAQMAVAYCRADSVTGQTVVVDGGNPIGMR
jgi:NAD(P)-dependent dehydrogenase (short-subunit alcohol dehydrogenase family)